MHGLFSLSEQTRIVLTAMNCSQEQLAAKISVTARHVGKILHEECGKRRALPKGAKAIGGLFNRSHPDPVAPHLRGLAATIQRVQALKRRKQSCGEELASMMAEWLSSFEFSGPRAEADDEELFLYQALRGHIYFAAAYDVSVSKPASGQTRDRDSSARAHPLAEVFSHERRGIYAKAAIDAFEKACAFARKQPYHKRDRYALFAAKTAANLGAAVFMAWSKGILPGLTLHGVKEIFDRNGVKDGLERLYRADPRNTRALFNMLCWCSVLKDEVSCLLWWERLIKADPAFLNTAKKHYWMNKSMSEDRDFAYLMDLLKSNGTIPNTEIKEETL
jgi:hypothetical protein